MNNPTISEAAKKAARDILNNDWIHETELRAIKLRRIERIIQSAIDAAARVEPTTLQKMYEIVETSVHAFKGKLPNPDICERDLTGEALANDLLEKAQSLLEGATPATLEHSRRHVWKFESKDQIAEILAAHLKSQGIIVPDGARFVWGIESNNSQGDNLTLVVDQDLI